MKILASLVLSAFVCVANAADMLRLKVGDEILFDDNNVDNNVISIDDFERYYFKDDTNHSRHEDGMIGRITQILHGHFLNPQVQDTVIYGELDNDHMQFYYFPWSRIMGTYYDGWEDEITTCQNPETGLTYLVDGTFKFGSYGAWLQLLRVNPETHAIETVSVDTTCGERYKSRGEEFSSRAPDGGF